MAKYVIVRTIAYIKEFEADSYEEAAIASGKMLDDIFKRDSRYDKHYVMTT